MTTTNLRLMRLAAGLGACLLAMPALAQEEPAEEPGFSPSIQFSGFVDTSVFWPIDGNTYDDGTDSDGDLVVSLDQVEVDVEAMPAAGLTLRADINYFPALGLALDDRLVEQGYARYYFNGGDDGAFLIAGKMNAPIGVESLDPVDMYQYSYGQLFSYATPSNLTGFFGGYATSAITAMVWVTNDWDAPPTPDSYLVGGRFAWSGSDGGVGLSSTFGPIGVGQLYQLMVDLDIVWAFDALTLFLEGNYGSSEQEGADGSALTSVGGLFKANYAFTDSLSATVRYDYLNREYGTVVEAHSVTGAFLFGITDNFGGVLEVRADIPAEGDTALTSALELTASF